MNKGIPVYVTGMGCISAAGLTVEENLATLDEGRQDTGFPVLFPVKRQMPVFMCAVAETDAVFSSLPGKMPPHGISRTTKLALYATMEALQAAGLSYEELAALRVGVCLGTSVGTSLAFLDYYISYCAGRQHPSDTIHTYLDSNPALALARFFSLRGPVQTLTNACSSGADAIGTAAGWIRSGLCDIAICGGCDALNQIIYCGFSSLQLLSPEPCRPFDKNRKGLNLGEGAGIMVLETAERSRDKPIAGRIRGYGTATDAYHLTAPHPEARGMKKALEQALAQADAAVSDIAFINAHGTATMTNDIAESLFFRTMLPQTPFVATKGCTGHTLGAAGAVEAVFAMAHLNRRRLPASPGFQESDPEAGINPVSVATDVDNGLAMSQSLAFGGNNSILLMDTGAFA